MKNDNRARQSQTKNRTRESPEVSVDAGGLVHAELLGGDRVGDGAGGVLTRQQVIPTEATDPDDLGDALTAGFKNAVEAAIQEAFDAGLAVPGRENGKPVERRPDGKVMEIEDPANWSPDGWKSRP